MKSLLKAAEAEQLLPMELPPAAAAALDAEEAHGNFTGDRLFSQDPDRYRACVEMLGRMAPVSMIAKVLRVSPNTVRAVREREGETIDDLKKRTVAHLAKFVGIAAERFAEEADSIDIEKLAIPMGIATEKLLLLTGQATSRVERIDAAPAPVDFSAYLDSIPEAQAAETRYIGEEISQRADGPGGVPAGPAALGTGTGSPATGAQPENYQGEPAACRTGTATAPADMLSAVSLGNGAMATALATTSGTLPAAGPASGAGGPATDPGTEADTGGAQTAPAPAP